MTLDSSTVNVSTRYLNNFCCYKNDKIISNSLINYGEYQQHEIDLLLTLISDQDIVFDIGANIGYHTTAFSSRAKQVYSFEAHPIHFEMLEKNTATLKNCTIKNIAVSDSSGKLNISDFDILEKNNYGAVLIDSEGVLVECESIDNMKIPTPQLVKIDVEGHEVNVLNGMQNLLKNNKPLVYFEAQETNDLPEIYKLLDDLNYSMNWCVVRNYSSDNYRNNQTNIFGNTAIFSILAYQKDYHNVHQWLPVQGPNDNWQRFTNDA